MTGTTQSIIFRKQLMKSMFSWNHLHAKTWRSYNWGDQHIKLLVLRSLTFKTCQNHKAVVCGRAQTVIKCLPASLVSLFSQCSLTMEDLTGLSHLVFYFLTDRLSASIIMLSLVHLGVLQLYFFFSKLKKMTQLRPATNINIIFKHIWVFYI